MHDVACEFARVAVRSKDAQKQLARTSLNKPSTGVKARRKRERERGLGTRVEKDLPHNASPILFRAPFLAPQTKLSNA